MRIILYRGTNKTAIFKIVTECDKNSQQITETIKNQNLDEWHLPKVSFCIF